MSLIDVFIVTLKGGGDVRSADLFKSPSFPCRSADYIITTDGIRDPSFDATT